MANAYYLAAKLNYFDSRVRGKRLILKSFFMRKKWVESAKVFEIVYIFALPISKIAKPFIERRRNNGND